MPFGSHPFQDKRVRLDVVLRGMGSPMPFGSHPFQDPT